MIIAFSATPSEPPSPQIIPVVRMVSKTFSATFSATSTSFGNPVYETTSYSDERSQCRSARRRGSAESTSVFPAMPSTPRMSTVPLPPTYVGSYNVEQNGEDIRSAVTDAAYLRDDRELTSNSRQLYIQFTTDLDISARHAVESYTVYRAAFVGNGRERLPDTMSKFGGSSVLSGSGNGPASTSHDSR